MDNLPWYDELPGYPGVSWFGSDYHRYHHRYGYEKSAPMVGPPVASRRGYRQLSPTTEPITQMQQPSPPPEDHYTRAREKTIRRSRRAASPRPSLYEETASRVPGRSRSAVAPTVGVDYGQVPSAVPTAASQYGGGGGYGQASSTVPMVTTAAPGAGATVNIGGQQIQQAPGHSLVIRPGPNPGAPPKIEQIPGYYTGP